MIQMSKFIKAAIRERKVTILLSIIILIFGMYSYHFIPKQENPDTSSPAAQIITTYPGASATDVENLVTKPVEDAVATLDGIDYIQSYSYDNASVVVVMLNYEVDYNEQWDLLRNELDDLQNNLPSGIKNSQINTDLTESAGFILSVNSEKLSYSQLADYANQYKDELDLVDGIKKIEIDGELERELVIEIDNQKLREYNLAIKDIYDLIKAQNTIIPPGSIKTETGKINLSVPKSFENIRDLENLILTMSKENGSLVRLRDVANIEFKYLEDDLKFKQNGKKAVLITGYFKDDKNIVLIGEDVREKINKLSNNLPNTVQVDEVLFLPEDVDKSVSDFTMNLLQGIILVIIVVLVGMGKRNSIIVSFTIPLSIATTFSLMYILDIEVQQVSIAALIIALGILVDNSIVISDAIQVKINEGKSHFEAAFTGTKEQSIPVFSSTLTTIAAFAPLMTLPGEAGEFAKALPQVVMISLTASFIVAMLVTPALASKFFKKDKKDKDNLKHVKKFYRKILNWNLENPIKAIFIVIIFFSVSLAGIKAIQIKMFPYVDKDIIYFDLESEISGDIDKNEEFIKSVEQKIDSIDEIGDFTTAIGGGLPRFYMTANTITPSDDKGQILAKFDLSQSDRFKTGEELAYYLQNKFDREVTKGSVTVNLLEINMPGPAINVRISGKNSKKNNQVANQVFNKLAKINGTINTKKNKGDYKYEYDLDIDEDLVSTLGLTKYDIQYQINLALRGNKVSVLRVKGNEYNIKIKSNAETIDDLMNLPIKSGYTNEKILVKQFADLKLTKNLNSIKRYDREGLVSVTSNVRPDIGISNVQIELEKYIDSIDTSGTKISFGGDNETITKYLTGLVAAGLFALVIVYIILLIQFNSLKQPVIILVTIPLSFIGIIAALLISNTPFTFTVGLGVASLFGIVVNNAILLIEYINRARKDGLDVKNSCIDSVEKRVSPILLSSLTTIFGLIPLVRANSSFFSPMAIALIGGLLVSTFLTINVIPTVYYLVERN